MKFKACDGAKCGVYYGVNEQFRTEHNAEIRCHTPLHNKRVSQTGHPFER